MCARDEFTVRELTRTIFFAILPTRARQMTAFVSMVAFCKHVRGGGKSEHPFISNGDGSGKRLMTAGRYLRHVTE